MDKETKQKLFNEAFDLLSQIESIMDKVFKESVDKLSEMDKKEPEQELCSVYTLDKDGRYTKVTKELALKTALKIIPVLKSQYLNDTFVILKEIPYDSITEQVKPLEPPCGRYVNGSHFNTPPDVSCNNAPPKPPYVEYSPNIDERPYIKGLFSK